MKTIVQRRFFIPTFTVSESYCLILSQAHMKKSKKKTPDSKTDHHFTEAESKIHALINRHINNENHKISREEYLNLMKLSQEKPEQINFTGPAYY